MSVIKPEDVKDCNFLPSAKPSRFGQMSSDRYDLSCENQEYITHKCVAEMTVRQIDCAAHLLKAARHYSNTLSQSAKHWGQVNLNDAEYHSDSMEISSTFWLPDITNWCHQQEETH